MESRNLPGDSVFLRVPTHHSPLKDKNSRLWNCRNAPIFNKTEKSKSIFQALWRLVTSYYNFITWRTRYRLNEFCYNICTKINSNIEKFAYKKHPLTMNNFLSIICLLEAGNQIGTMFIHIETQTFISYKLFLI